jgi:ferric-dicitrate binding protein FerR (iron transport regulator)
MFRMLVAGVFALALPLAASATAVVESMKGSVRAGETALTQGQRFVAPASISTAAGAQVTLKFDDGMQIVLDENSLLRIVDFRHTDNGTPDRAVVELLRGGARVVTGRIARDNPKQFFFRVPQTQLMLERPADFSVVLVNPAYITVHVGSVTASNGWGATTLGPGSTTVVATNAAAPAAVAGSAVPGSAAASMKALQTASVGLPAGGSASGAGAAAGTAGGVGFAVPAVLVTVGIVAAAVAKEGDGGEGAAAATTHH